MPFQHRAAGDGVKVIAVHPVGRISQKPAGRKDTDVVGGDIAGKAEDRHCQTNWPGAEEAIIEDSQGAS